MKNKEAYPQRHINTKHVSPAPMEEWERIRKKLHEARELDLPYTQRELIDHYTQNYTSGARARFEQWLRNIDNYSNLYNVKVAGEVMEKTAQVSGWSSDKDERFKSLKKKLSGRCDALKKLLRELVDGNYLPMGEEMDKKIIYLSRIVQKLEEEITTLRRPNLLEAAVRGKANAFRKIGFIEGAEILDEGVLEVEAAFTASLVKTAAVEGENVVKVMDLVREELDMLNYSDHLDRLYRIMTNLKQIGRYSEKEAVEKIIQKDLNGLEDISKKLAQVYTDLGQISITEFSKKRKELAEPKIEQPKEEVEELKEFEKDINQQLEGLKPTETPAPTPKVAPKKEAPVLGKPAPAFS